MTERTFIDGLRFAIAVVKAQQSKNPYYGTAIFKGEVIKFAKYLDGIVEILEREARGEE